MENRCVKQPSSEAVASCCLNYNSKRPVTATSTSVRAGQVHRGLAAFITAVFGVLAGRCFWELRVQYTVLPPLLSIFWERPRKLDLCLVPSPFPKNHFPP